MAMLCVFVTFAPYLPGDYWWGRGWDFPRVQIAIVSVVSICIALAVSAYLPLMLLIVTAGIQIVQIIPFTPLYPTEVELVDPGHTKPIHFLSLNVLMENNQYARVASYIRKEDPDVILLMETDGAWAEAMADTLARYSVVVSYPKDDHYGIIFATRLESDDARIVYLADDDIPAIRARLRTTEGTSFTFVGLHPQPPVPGTTTEDRDKQIRRAATIADTTAVPTIVMGDFNDVAWSHTARRYKEIGGFKDPRIGRGLVASFDANRWWMRFPIDHLYITEDIDFVSFKRGPHVGSDHFPMLATIIVPVAE